IVSQSSPTPPDGDSCRLNPTSTVWVKFFDNAPDKPFTLWTRYMIEDAQLARTVLQAHYHKVPRRTYAVGTSNGAYQMRRALEAPPALFDGGVDWEGTFIDARGPNLLIDLPPAIASYGAYAQAGFDAASPAAAKIKAAGYPPDIVAGTTSLWGLYFA